MKKLLICLTVLFSAFLFTNKVSAEATPVITVGSRSVYNLEDCTYFTYTEEQIENLIQNAKAKMTENGYNADEYNKFILTVKKGSIAVESYFYLFNDLDIENNKYIFSSGSSNSMLGVTATNTNASVRFYKYRATNAGQLSYNVFFEPDSSQSGFILIQNADSSGGYLLTNFDLKDSSGNVLFPQNYNTEPTPNEFTINTYDTEHGGHWFGVNYIQGQQDNTVNFYIQDSGILTISAAKGYEIEKIYYDEALTQEANLNDIVETDTNLYVTWKSKIEINKQIATDLSGNDVITINYDFSKIYNENYSYWISNDGTNYVNITDKLNSNHKYASGVYFAGDYFAMVKDENNETISVHYINIDYYRITPTTEIGKDIDENGNIKPYLILDYSAYRETKNNIICEYSIDNGNTWIDITKELDINMKYKLYINIGDKVTSRVRTNGNTILPGETGGSNYDVTEDFYNDILINEEKDVLEEFKDLLTNKNDNIFIKFKEVWEAFKDSVLFNYIYIIIVGSLIILIIKSAKRN